MLKPNRVESSSYNFFYILNIEVEVLNWKYEFKKSGTKLNSKIFSVQFHTVGIF